MWKTLKKLNNKGPDGKMGRRHEKFKLKLHRDVILHLSKWQKLKNRTTCSFGESVGKQAHLTLRGNVNHYNPSGGLFGNT